MASLYDTYTLYSKRSQDVRILNASNNSEL